jgi:threonine synthase
MKFISTREANPTKEVEFSEAILNPGAPLGGLYVPKELPSIDESFLDESLSYKEIARRVLDLFDIDIESEVIDEALDLYDKFDDPCDPTPLVKIGEDLFVNELYHGPTRAFKDMALQPFGYILSNLAKKQNRDFLILAATSGDTGPATLESFKNRDNIKVVCLYPDGGTSDVQRLQMVTEDGANLKVIGIKGNFDDAQNALKSLLTSDRFKKTLKEKEINLSAANSVNFGRIIFQIIYHIRAYQQLLKRGEIKREQKIYITVPSGNFGNALGAYYAKKMGLPIKKILIASNENSVLKELIEDGVYDIRDRELKLTLSPAMDILKSSNVERVLFDLFGPNRVKELMESLNRNGFYRLSSEEQRTIKEIFSAVSSDDDFVKKAIKEQAKKGYILDPHTATCLKAYGKLNKEPLKMVICSTAEWTKFAPTMMSAIKEDSKRYSDKEAIEFMKKSFDLTPPKSIEELFTKEILHKDIIDKDKIEDKIVEFISK